MRLYLSSHGVGDQPGALLGMLGNPHGRRAAIIANGFDACSAAAREIYLAEIFNPHTILQSLGVAAEFLDLRAYFGDPAGLRRRLSGFDLVWVMSGNSFVLRRAMQQSGFDNVIETLCGDDAIIYAGDGAGAAVAGPTLRGMELLDDPWEVPENYEDLLVWAGLRLTGFTIVPHFQSNHPDSSAAEKLVNYLRARRLPYRALSDGDVVVAAGARGAGRPLLKRIA